MWTMNVCVFFFVFFRSNPLAAWHVGAAVDNPQTVAQLSCQKRVGQLATAQITERDATQWRSLQTQQLCWKITI